MLNNTDIERLQKSWAEGVIALGKNKEEKNLPELAYNFVDAHYAYSEYGCLFKPTRANKISFRNSIEGAVSYFVGGNESFPEDMGFAVSPPISAIRFENSEIFNISKEISITQGQYFFTLETRDEEVKVEYSFVYKKLSENIKIILHHSSFPFQG